MNDIYYKNNVMSSFGIIKTKIERLLEESYGKPSFKNNLKGFINHVIKNKPLSEAYYLYDELSSNKGLNENIVDEYISESFDHLKTIIDNNKKKIEELSEWVDELLKEDVDNNYEDIDKQIYTKNVVKNLESLLESKQKIRKTLLSSKLHEETNHLNLPLSSMISIANKTLNKELQTLSEEEKKELHFYTSLKGKNLSEEIERTKQVVLNKLSNSLNESTDSDLSEKIQKTIDKINKSEKTLTSLYKLKQLEKGL
jgi:DNA helicase HerA-like ATPase